jgi:IclR family transcriptional regulator, pca regulon regulatory protein
MSPRAARPGAEQAWWPSDMRDPRYSRSLARGLAILSCFTPEQPVLGIANIGDQLDMNHSTVHRYVSTLVALGYLEQEPSRKYRLGLRVTDLGMSALGASGLREHARPHLQELRQRTGHTTSLAVLYRTEVLYVDRARCLDRRREIDLELGAGSRLPAYCTATGKLLLAHLPELDRRELLSQIELAPRAPNTITSRQALQEELGKVLEDDLAVNDQELAAGLRAIAAPIRDQSQKVVAAVSLAVSATEMSLDDLVDALAAHLVATAEQISARLGWSRDETAPVR